MCPVHALRQPIRAAEIRMDPLHQCQVPRFQISGAEFITQAKNVPRFLQGVTRLWGRRFWRSCCGWCFFTSRNRTRNGQNTVLKTN